MGTARRIAIALSALVAVATSVAAMALWPLVHKDDFAFIQHVQRDVEFGWLLLQAAVPLFAMCLLTAVGAAVLAWRIAVPRRAPPR
jgi:Ni/Fe-hydrogenase subunit HybB-like protein